MTVRTDITIDWTTSPRIITVAAPSTELLLQDLVDTLRQAEDEIANMMRPKLLDAAGKQALTATKQVGITVELRDALVAFEARGGPTYEQCFIRDGNLVAYDSADVQLTSSIDPTAFTQVVSEADVSAALISAGTLNTQMDEMHKIHGLDDANPLVIDKGAGKRTAGAGIDQDIDVVGDVTTVTRNP